MKLCFVTSSFPRYVGDYAGNFVYKRAIDLSERYEVHVIYPTNVPAKELPEEPFRRHPLPYPFKSYPLAQVHGLDLLNVPRLLLSMAGAIKRIRSQHKIDLFYAFWTIPSAFVCSLSCGKTPYLVELLGSDLQVFGRNGITRLFIKHSLRKVRKIIATTEEVKREAATFGAREEDMLVIRPGIDMDRFRPMDKGALRAKLNLPSGLLLLFVGSLFKIKRVDRIIQAGANLARNHDFNIIIIGDGPERHRFEALARALGMSNVHFMGALTYQDVADCMGASDIFILLSDTEGLPSAVQEAMASSLPVVASDVGGLPDIITDGVNGYLVKDDKEVEEALSCLMSSPELRAELGSNARAFAWEHLSSGRVHDQVNELCRSVLENEYATSASGARGS